jgi:hypothetical protein
VSYTDMNEVKQLEKFLVNAFTWDCEKTKLVAKLSGSHPLMFDLKNDLGVSKYKTLHDFYFNDDLYPCIPNELKRFLTNTHYDDTHKWRRKWRIYFEALLEIKDLPDNIRESINNILIMDSI